VGIVVELSRLRLLLLPWLELFLGRPRVLTGVKPGGLPIMSSESPLRSQGGLQSEFTCTAFPAGSSDLATMATYKH